MKKLIIYLGLLLFSQIVNAKPTGTYKIVVEGFDWGAGVNKVILNLSDTTSKVNPAEYQVFASRKSATGPINDEQNKRDIITAYVSDDQGNRVKTGSYISLVLAVMSMNFLGVGDCQVLMLICQEIS
jgi:DNA-binding beta-propeller fold protein YncE